MTLRHEILADFRRGDLALVDYEDDLANHELGRQFPRLSNDTLNQPVTICHATSIMKFHRQNTDSLSGQLHLIAVSPPTGTCAQYM